MYGQNSPWALPQLGSCASSGRALRLWAVSALPGRGRPTERPVTASSEGLHVAASKATHFTAFDHIGEQATDEERDWIRAQVQESARLKIRAAGRAGLAAELANNT